MSEKNAQLLSDDAKPPPYSPPSYPSPGDPAAQPQYPPPGQGYNWQQPPPPVTETPLQGGYTPQSQPGYQAQPPFQQQPGYQAQPGYQGYPGYPGYPAQPGYQYPAGATTTQHAHTNVTVVQQGGPSVLVAPQISPPDYCALAWFACLFCFWPTGICAILKSNETRAAIYRGDFVSANQLSMETRKLANMTIAIGIALYVVIVVVRVALSLAY